MRLLIPAVLFFLYGLSIQQVQAQGVVDTYVGSFSEEYPDGFAEMAFCSGVIFDLGTALGNEGLVTGDKKLVKLSQRILDRQNDFNDLIINAHFTEFSPEFEGMDINDLPEDDLVSGVDKVVEAISAVNSSERYEFIMDFVSAYEWLGLYSYCTEAYLEPTKGRNITLHEIMETDAGFGGFIQPAVDFTIEAGNVIVDWSKSSYHKVASLDVCEGDLDVAGGAALGTAATSVLAGESVLVVVGTSTVLVATAPAVATGVTAASLVGSTVFLTAKGFCYLKN